MPRPHIAYVSPLPPQRTGIADYSAELLPHLAEHVDLELFVEAGARPELPEPGVFPVHPLAELPERLRQGALDLAVYQLGNNPLYHAETYRMLLAVPGVVVLHEFMLHHLVRGLTLDRGDAAAYLEEHRYCAGESGLAMARRALESGLPHDPWSYPLFERVVDRSLGVLVHNDFARERVLASRPRARVARVPLPFDPGARPELSRQVARERLGLPPESFVVATFGFITPAKRLPVVISAFAALRRRHPQAVLLLVGETSPHYDLGSLLEGERGTGVRLTGRVSLEEFEGAMAACDVAVNFRHPTGGETSASLVRLLGRGVPTLVTDAGSFRELPGDACIKVPLGEGEEEQTAAFLLALAADPELRRRLGDNARRHLAAHHRLEQTAGGYAGFLERVIADPWPPVEPVPPLAPYPRSDLYSELAARAAGALCDLGVGEEDDEALRTLAEALAEVGDAATASPGRWPSRSQ